MLLHPVVSPKFPHVPWEIQYRDIENLLYSRRLKEKEEEVPLGIGG